MACIPNPESRESEEMTLFLSAKDKGALVNDAQSPLDGVLHVLLHCHGNVSRSRWISNCCQTLWKGFCIYIFDFLYFYLFICILFSIIFISIFFLFSLSFLYLIFLIIYIFGLYIHTFYFLFYISIIFISVLDYLFNLSLIVIMSLLQYFLQI